VAGETAAGFLRSDPAISDCVAIEWADSGASFARDADGLIAATAKVHDLILVTRNVADFDDAACRSSILGSRLSAARGSK